MSRLLKKNIILICDLICVICGAYLSDYFLNYYIQVKYSFFLVAIVVYAIIYLLAGLFLHNFSRINRFFSMREVRELTIANAAALVGTSVISYCIFHEVTLRFMILFTIFSTMFMSLIRLSWRTYREYREGQSLSHEDNPRRLLMVGAGQGAEMFINTQKHIRNIYDIIGIVDDSKQLENAYLSGYPIIGKIEDIPEIVEKYNVQMITITAPSMKKKRIEKVLNYGHELKVEVTRMPNVEKTLSGKEYSRGQGLRQIDIGDLLGRKEVVLDDKPAARAIRGEKVLITGAGGSIGSEICRQLIKFEPSALYLVGHGENSIYLINEELKSLKLEKTQIYPIIADVQDRERIFNLFESIRPDIVYHAAAHKHVPLMELNPSEAIKNNIYGTTNVAEAADKYNVGHFVMISTDKANNPPNVMGATKRICEMIVTCMNEKSNTVFSAVRFGNVLGSRGSVIPKFQKQIEEGGPITITDVRMTRYFMTIPEASRLVIQAGARAEGGELFILDMGKPVYILDLAKKMIKLSGHTEEEIQIKEVGRRPGEKLFEELLLTDETTGKKVDNKIYVGKVKNIPIEEIKTFVSNLDLFDEEQLKKKLVAFVKRDAKNSGSVS